MEAVRQACIGANPGILDLVFGCEGIWHKRKNDDHELKDIKSVVLNNDIGLDIYTYEPWEKGSKNLTYHTITILQDDFEIIGRAITLADVLLAMKTQRIRLCQDGVSSVYFETYEEIDMFTHMQGWRISGVSWNLKEDLEGQSPETIDFLHGLLCG